MSSSGHDGADGASRRSSRIYHDEALTVLPTLSPRPTQRSLLHPGTVPLRKFSTSMTEWHVFKTRAGEVGLWDYSNSSTPLRLLAGVGSFGAGVAFSSFFTARATETRTTQALLAAAYIVFLFCVALTLIAELALTVSVRQNPDHPATYGRVLIHLAIFLSYACVLIGTMLLTLSLIVMMPIAILALGCVGMLSIVIVIALSLLCLRGDALKPLVELYQWARDGEALKDKRQSFADATDVNYIPPSHTPSEGEFRELLSYYRRYRTALLVLENHDGQFRWATSAQLRAKRLAHAAQALKYDSMATVQERIYQTERFLDESMFKWVPIIDQLTADEQASRKFWRQPLEVQMRRASLLLYALTAAEDIFTPLRHTEHHVVNVHEQNETLIEQQNAAVRNAQSRPSTEAMVSIAVLSEEPEPL